MGAACSQARVERIRAEHGCHHGILGSVAGTDARRPALTQGCTSHERSLIEPLEEY